MMKNLVVSELLSIFAMLFEHRISEQECNIPLYYANSIGDFWSHPSWVCGSKPYKLSKRGK